MKRFDLTTLPRMIDISVVRTDVTLKEVYNVIEVAKKYKFICVFAMPSYTPLVIDSLKNEPDISVGGVVGFPSGADTTSVKVAQTKELVEMGCDEIDMVINVGKLMSKAYEDVKQDIEAVVATAAGKPVKAILEISYLSDDEIIKGSLIAVEAGVTFVKTGTGWGSKPTTADTIKLIKNTIGDQAYIKAAGGARTLDAVLDMKNEGCTRFGIGVNSALSILEEAYKREGKVMPKFESDFEDHY